MQQLATEPYTDIRREQRVVHSRPDYGRGKVARVYWSERQAAVAFDRDGGITRRVWLRDLTPEPADMPPRAPVVRPPYRLIWPVQS